MYYLIKLCKEKIREEREKKMTHDSLFQTMVI